jgi:hypothetical protein
MIKIIDCTGIEDDVTFFKPIEFDGFAKKSGLYSLMIDKIVDGGRKYEKITIGLIFKYNKIIGA